MSEALDVRLAAAAKRPVHEAIAAFARHLAEETGALAALFYGSNLRTGTLEGVIDYYLLTEGMPESGLWPCVSYREWEHGGQKLRAKIATMTLAKFAQACQGATLDTTIWARFVQPCAVVFARDSSVEGKVLAALAHAAQTAARLAVAIGPASGAESDFWRALFRATYRAELRVEKPGRENAIVEALSLI
ncbi:MAG: hypothetical protein N2Z59_06070, partial [Alteraurantiacibacter sp.]|nr:hypothetical protein [Alteraurantiacibacter sp.]